MLKWWWYQQNKTPGFRLYSITIYKRSHPFFFFFFLFTLYCTWFFRDWDGESAAETHRIPEQTSYHPSFVPPSLRLHNIIPIVVRSGSFLKKPIKIYISNSCRPSLPLLLFGIISILFLFFLSFFFFDQLLWFSVLNQEKKENYINLYNLWTFGHPQ